MCDDPTVPIMKFNTNVYEESENNRIKSNDVIEEKNVDRFEGCPYTHSWQNILKKVQVPDTNSR